MTAQGGRRPITSSDFNRLLFALVLLAALAVLARLIARQDSRADAGAPSATPAAEYLRTGDALFVRGEWSLAADAYFGAFEVAAAAGQAVDSRVYARLAECLYNRGERRAGLHFLRLYRTALERYRSVPPTTVDPADPFWVRENLEAEIVQTDMTLNQWSRAN
jgi:hypothetical protein